jgi:GNAT superfamily N-acetyltransferase
VSPLVRVAVLADAPALGRVHVRAWQEAYRGVMSDAYLDGLSEPERAGLWAGTLAAPPPGTQLWVAERGGQLLGFAGGGPARGDQPAGLFELYALNVDPPAYRSGVGTALVAAFTAWAVEQGAHELVLWVVRENGRARRFYERQGWQADGGEHRSQVLGAPVDEVRYRLGK